MPKQDSQMIKTIINVIAVQGTKFVNLLVLLLPAGQISCLCKGTILLRGHAANTEEPVSFIYFSAELGL